MWQFHPLIYILAAAVLLVLALAVFGAVRQDYRNQGRLSPRIAALQTGFFCVYALCSYVFLDSRLAHIQAAGGVLLVAIILMAVGFATVLFSMPALGQRSFGRQVGNLYTAGLYRYSRNPQLVGGCLFVLGYALLWPAWPGLLWALLWLPISALMVRGEEEHLLRSFGQEYRDYCTKTPRYLGLPK